MIDSGTEPNTENFGAWYLTDKNIVFIFQDYQIGPYAQGSLEFPLRKTEVSNILRAQFK